MGNSSVIAAEAEVVDCPEGAQFSRFSMDTKPIEKQFKTLRTGRALLIPIPKWWPHGNFRAFIRARMNRAGFDIGTRIRGGKLMIFKRVPTP